jgi:uncharacterized protein YndB with AHSA1/START domain
MPYTYTLTAIIPASPREIYDTWLDSAGHSEMTGGDAAMSDEIGAKVSAWDGYISGRNLELVPGERIVQSWRTTQFTDDHDDSLITVTLEDTNGDTRLTLIHSNVPDEQTSYERSGWQTHYFEPMIAYFSNLGGEKEEEEDLPPMPAHEPAAAPPKAKSRPKRAASKRKAKAAAPKSGRRAAGKAKPKRAKAAKKATKAKTKAKPKAKPKSKSKTKTKTKARAKSKRTRRSR